MGYQNITYLFQTKNFERTKKGWKLRLANRVEREQLSFSGDLRLQWKFQDMPLNTQAMTAIMYD